MTKSKNMKGGNPPIVEAKPLDTNGGRSTFDLTKPFEIFLYFSFFSQMVLISIIASSTIVFSNFKGLIYLFIILVITAARSFLLQATGSSPLVSDGTICTAVKIPSYGNSTFSTFLLSFTLAYLSTPMFINNSVNWLLFASLVFYIVFDLGMRILNGCISFSKNAIPIFLDLVAGLGLGIGLTFLMYTPSLGNGANLFFNETSTTKEVCSMPKKQTYKCAVYKNGELVG